MKNIWFLAVLSLISVAQISSSLAQTKKVKESFKVLDDGSVNISNEAVQDENCLFGSDGEIDIGVSGGVAPYSYEWRDAVGTVVATS
jgi:hypothetical protein